MKTRKVRIQYYALLREERGCSTETRETSASTAMALYRELAKVYGFSIDMHLLKVAVNDEFADWEQPLEDNDSVMFIPPVAGG